MDIIWRRLLDALKLLSEIALTMFCSAWQCGRRIGLFDYSKMLKKKSFQVYHRVIDVYYVNRCCEHAHRLAKNIAINIQVVQSSNQLKQKTDVIFFVRYILSYIFYMFLMQHKTFRLIHFLILFSPSNLFALLSRV